MSIEEKKNQEGHQSNWRPALIGGLLIMSVLVILQVFGIFKTFDTTRNTANIDLNSVEYQNRPMQQRRPEKPNSQVEATLQEIADEFQGQVFSDIRTANSQKGWGLTDDQAKFYDDMRVLYGKNSPNWLSAVRNAYDTYQTVQTVFGDGSDVTNVLKDADRSMHVFQQLKDLFGLPIQSSETLSKNGATKVSDWARYIEAMKVH